MKIKGMRWGYDGGGFCCGPVSGSNIVEVEFTDDDNETRYAVVSLFESFEKVMITKNTRFDLMMDQDVEEGYSEENAIECFDYEMSEMEPEMFTCKYAQVINVARHAMEAYDSDYDDDEELAEKEAKAFIAPYTDKDVSEIELPIMKAYSWFDDEDEEDEDDYEDEDDE